MTEAQYETEPAPQTQPAYWLTRFVILRLLGAIYAIAFLVAINQIIPLMGAKGLTPMGDYLQLIRNSFGSDASGFMRLPSVFWFGHSDTTLLVFAWIGFIVSVVVAAGYANALMMTLLWFTYLSFVHTGGEWYGYGWEIQLTETGFLAIFLCPLLDMRPFPKYAPPMLVIILFRWLICRIMLGAGLIKLRGDESWRNATALYYHFESQPIPGPLSRWFHFLPRPVLKAGVWLNWLAELAAPLFVFWPRIARHIAGVVIILFQVNIILSGNLSFLNWLTIVPALACFDDEFLAKVLPGALVRKAKAAAEQAEVARPMLIITRGLAIVIAILSIQPVVNLFSSQQVMNTSFGPLDLVNTYGAFGTVGQERLNVVFEGTRDNDTSDAAHWKPYLYKGLPVLLDKQPPQIAPYQLRLDWQMWFASMATPDDYPWTVHLVSKLLHNDESTLSLFASNPFPNQPPRYVRAVLYRYRFAQPGNPQGLWWNRDRVGLWLLPLSANDPRLTAFLKSQGWK